jgi:outer membrane receptor protein involved in Fe transport
VLGIGGGRPGSGTKYVVDGVQLPPGASNFTNQAPGSVETITTFSSGIPARYGDASGGLVTITTKGATATTRGSVQYEHSVDGYNSNQLTVNLSGPLLRKKDSSGVKRPIVGYNIVADGIFTEDSDPSYTPNYYVNDDKLAQIQAQPLVIVQENGVTRSDFATNYLRASDFHTSKKRENASFYRGQLSGKLDFNLNQNTSVRLGASYFGTDANQYDRRQSLFGQQDNSQQLSQTGRGYLRFTQKFGSKVTGDDMKDNVITNAFYTVQADYQKDYTTTQDKRHGHNTFDYGYVGKFEEQYAPFYSAGTPDPETGIIGVRLTGYTPTKVIFTPGDKNPELTNYTKQVYQYLPFTPIAQENITAFRGLRNGDLPQDVYGMYRNPGFARGGWNKTNNDQVSISIDASFDLKHKKTTHSVEFGLTYQQRNERFYAITGAALSSQGGGIWGLMRQITERTVGKNSLASTPIFIKNGVRYTIEDVNSGKINPGPNDTIFYERKYDVGGATAFDTRLRQKLLAQGLINNKTDYINTDRYDPSFYSLDMFSADDLLNSGNSLVGYRGYTYDGKLVTGNVNFNDFWTEYVRETDINGNSVKYFTRPIGAYRPNYIAGYLSDYITYKDFRITLGVRVERFDNNTKVLRDPYSLYPVHNVAHVRSAFDSSHGGVIPGNISNNAVVYLGNNTVNPASIRIIGYRDGDVWYDASGKEVQDPQILRTSTNSAALVPFLVDPTTTITDTAFNPDNSFTDYKPAVNVMPRINFSFPLSDDALFYAHYDVLYQRPTGVANAVQTDYMFMDQNPSDIYQNSNLRPERMIDYEVGFQQRLSERSGITISGFYKERKDQIQIRPYLYAYPTTYYTYGNRDYSTYKGLSLAYELRRLGNLSLNINYTLSFTEGTGSSAASSNGGDQNRVNGNSVLQQFIASGLPNLRTQFPVTFDSRHNINAQIDYRFAGDRRGPVIAGTHLLENSGIQFIFRARSGEPYTKYATAQGQQSGASNSPVIEGTVNGSRINGHFGLDMNVDKTIPLGFKKAKEGEQVQPSRLGLNIYAYVRNLLNIRDVRSVYGFTGRAGDDGYLTSAQGNSYKNSTPDAQSFTDYYNMWQQNPDQIGPPRQVVLGLRLNF